MTNPFDHRPPPQRTAHLICHNRRSAPQTYIIGQDANGEGGVQVRAMEGEHLYLREDLARKLYEQTGKTVFEFIGWDGPPTSEHMAPLKPAKTIDQIFAEQQAQAPEVAERLARANAVASPNDLAFVPTNQPSLQPRQDAPVMPPDIVQARGNLASLPMPSSEDFADALAQQPGATVDPPFPQPAPQSDVADLEAERVARVIAKLKQRNS